MAKVKNDWQSLIAEPETKRKDNFKVDEPDPWYIKRDNVFYYLNAGVPDAKEYSVAIVRDRNDMPFLMTDVATIKRFRFKSPKSGICYFENLKVPMDPELLFNMDLLTKKDHTEEELKELKAIKKHGDLIQRYKDLQFSKVVNFGWAQGAPDEMINQRLKKVSLTAYLGVWTNWDKTQNTKKVRDLGVRLFTSVHKDYQTKFRGMVAGLGKTHAKLQPTWFEDFFSTKNGVKAVVSSTIGDMKVGGAGATIKLVKLGKDPIDDAACGISSPITAKDIKNIYPGPENELSILHYYLAMKSDGPLWHEEWLNRFEEAIEQLEKIVASKVLDNKVEASSAAPAAPVAEPATLVDDDLPF